MSNARISLNSMTLTIKKGECAPIIMRKSVFSHDEWVFLTNFTQKATEGFLALLLIIELAIHAKKRYFDTSHRIR
jgi:hypothetical protein